MLSFSFEPYAEGTIWSRGDIGGRKLAFKVVEGASTVESSLESASPDDVTLSLCAFRRLRRCYQDAFAAALASRSAANSGKWDWQKGHRRFLLLK